MSSVAEKRKKPVQKQADDLVSKVNRTGVPLYIYIDRDLQTALLNRLKTSRRTKTEEVSIALEEYLAKYGNWPLPTSA